MALEKEEMNPFDRVTAALKGEPTDRVPIGWLGRREVGFGLPQVTVADVVREKSGYKLYKGIKAMVERFHPDMIAVMTYTTVEAVAMGTKDKYFADQLPAPIDYAIKSPEDLEKTKIPDPRVDGDLPCLYNALKKVSNDFSGQVPIGAGTVGPFSVGARIRGLWDISFDIMRRPWFAHDVVKHATEACINIIEGFREAGATGTSSGAGSETVLGIEHFRQFCVPYERMYHRKAKKLGYLSMSRHICSGPSADLVIDEFPKFGFDNLPILVWGYYKDAQTMQQKKKLFTEYTPVVAVGGTLRASDELFYGTPAQVEAESVKLLDVCSPGGRYFHMADCCIPPTTPLENLDAFVISAKKYRPKA
ncbi:MAG: hypothetical protein NO516_01720 [Candidatus Methanomethylicia archaeon]|nr:hypothetical protein [Candidatus Methanomethylicia archaeon]